MKTPDIFLNPNEKQSVTFCVPVPIRDEQIKLSSKRIKKRIEPNNNLTEDPIAIVGYGPSLNDTWEEIKKFKYIMTCSGAHKFLVERGIIPTHHVEVDPRKHKYLLIGTPQKETIYYIASACNKTMFDLLEGYDVRLWHVFSNEEDFIRFMPRGEWALSGGSSVGLRALNVARFIGFKNFHIFGMDGNFSEKYGKHAGEHPNQPNDHQLCEYGGKVYKTTTAVVECARQTFTELDKLPDVTVKFYGEGLIQEMAKNYVMKKNPDNILGFFKPRLISEEMLALNKQLFMDYPDYGIGGGAHSEYVLQLYNNINGRSILDYGCGRGYLAKSLDFPIWEYDPAVEGKDAEPRPADLVVATDVLEHVEPDRIYYVLDDLKRCVKKLGFFVISNRDAYKVLANNKNAHSIVKNIDWWRDIIKQYFIINDSKEDGDRIFIIVSPLISLTDGYIKI